jgi:hypothetical protein
MVVDDQAAARHLDGKMRFALAIMARPALLDAAGATRLDVLLSGEMQMGGGSIHPGRIHGACGRQMGPEGSAQS